MKKRVLALVLATAILAACCAVSVAAEGDLSGFYNIGDVSNVTITARSGSGIVASNSQDVDNDGAEDVLFPNSDRLAVQFTGAVSGADYGVLLVEGDKVPTKDDEILYIDQVKATSGTLSFQVYPILPEESTDMTLYISSNASGSNLISVPLSYVNGSVPVKLPTLATVNGAQIRTTGNQGLRFISTIEKTSGFNRVVEFGTVMLPTEFLDDPDDLKVGAVCNGVSTATIPAVNLYEETDTTITFTAVLTNVKQMNYAREYSARAYAILDDGTVLHAPTGASRSIYAVAQRGLENPNESDEIKAIYQAIIDIVENQ